MLTGPREALAEQSSFVNGLVGLAGLAEVVRALAADKTGRVSPATEADDLIHLLLGVASLGEAVDRLVERARADQPQEPAANPPRRTVTRWLR